VWRNCNWGGLTLHERSCREQKATGSALRMQSCRASAFRGANASVRRWSDGLIPVLLKKRFFAASAQFRRTSRGLFPGRIPEANRGCGILGGPARMVERAHGFHKVLAINAKQDLQRVIPRSGHHHRLREPDSERRPFRSQKAPWRPDTCPPAMVFAQR
jgi:hypothetical protein